MKLGFRGCFIQFATTRQPQAYTYLASLTCGKERPPKVEIYIVGIFPITASSVNALFKT